jgi:hypothetical protein
LTSDRAGFAGAARRALAGLLLAIAATGGPLAAGARAAATTARPGFGKPVRVAGPVGSDLIPVQLSYSEAGSSAAAFGVSNADLAGNSHGSLAQAAANAPLHGARTVSGTQQLLGLAFRGATLELLAGTSPHVVEFGALEPCCSQAMTMVASPGGAVSRVHKLVSGLGGATQGRLVSAGGRLLAAVADEEGVWAAQSDTGGRFGPTRVLDPAGAWVQALDATALKDGSTIVVWSAKPSQFAPGPTAILDARGSARSAPATPAIAIAVPPTHQIDELAVAAHGTVPTVAWVESSYDRTGARQSRVYAEDLAGAHQPHPLSPAGALASELTLAGSADGAQVVAFQACSRAGTCTVDAATRRATGGGFGRTATLGASDGSEAPAAAASSLGQALVAWISPAGNVKGAIGAPGARFAAPLTVSGAAEASDPAATFAPTGATALLGWTQGISTESLMAATYVAPVRSGAGR